ncbi:S41 family peptidase [Thermosynechococcus sp. JY1334]|uniref:S41 family peptidase n=1 Tax=unclassified Thermosynechococcus TaxID=2622553 RepID=UPI0026726056|nr:MULTISPECIES: S41 family peptidase [unclassified Thermosynechococcus]MDR7898134.1 S41 family peptidase [Thermosynechococcus sp. JY1332]MDR7905535.1 S41 family peptidase [Thermosynechococcus sp. JY1334]WKT85265.1 S41 family peptidase [Thermosynechococcus sp. JY1339]WNC54208.1 S41 family peptidase [Thermosynechococcus sp. JY1331]
MPQFMRLMGLQHWVLVGSSVVAAVLAAALPSDGRMQDSPKALVDEVWQIVQQEYVDESFNQVDWLAVRRQLLAQRYTSREQAYAAIRGMLQQLNDPYTRFMTPEEFAALRTQTSGEVSGIGIRLTVDEKTQQLTILEPLENSPATKAGIRAGDRLLAIDGHSTRRMSIEEASRRIRGRVGTPIELQLFRPNRGTFRLTLTRALIELPAVRSLVKEEGGARIGYIYLSEFTAHAADQLRAAIRKLEAEKVEGFVLDLRGNPGGLLQAGIDIARMWLNQGLIVRTVDRSGHTEQARANQSALTNLPLVVLVDHRSASSSEILTGALQDNGRAIVVGTPTYGKALVQSIHQLSDGSGLSVTVAHYYTPNGTDINRTGITPNVMVTLPQEVSTNPRLWTTAADRLYQAGVAQLRQVIYRSQAPKPVNTAQTGEQEQFRQPLGVPCPVQ